MYRNGIDDFELLAAKVPTPIADEFRKKVGKGKTSAVLREMITMFNNGKIKVTIQQTQTIGG